MEDEILEKCIKILSKTFSVRIVDDNAIGISFKNSEELIALVITEEAYPDKALLSVAVDCPDPFSIAQITLLLCNEGDTYLAEPFYYDSEGECFWGEAAYTEMGRGKPDEAQKLYDLASPGKLLN